MAHKEREIARKDGEIAAKDQEIATLGDNIKQLQHEMEVIVAFKIPHYSYILQLFHYNSVT